MLFAAGLFGVGMLPQALQRPDTAHLAWVSCVPLALAPLAITEVVRAWRPRLPARTIGMGVVAAFLVLRHPVPDRAALRRPGRPDLRPRRARRVDHPGRPELLLRVGRGGLGRPGGHRPARRRGPSPGERLLRRPGRPAPHALQRRVLLLPVPGAHAGHPLHRDGPRHRQRRGLRPGRRGALGRLADPVGRVVGLGRAERLPDRRARRAEPGGAATTSAWSTSTAPARTSKLRYQLATTGCGGRAGRRSLG